MQLNVEQRKIIECKPNGHSLIRGVAGSGKTTVAVKKIPLLLKNYCSENDDYVLMATYNKSLSKYVKYIYDITKEELDFQSSFFDEDRSNRLEIKNIDSLIFYYFRKYTKRNNLNIEVANSKEIKDSMIEAINIVKNKNPNIDIISPKFLSFIKDEITWIKGCNYLESEEYQSVDRIGRVIKNNSEGPQKLRKNSKKRQAIFDVLVEYNNILKSLGKVDFQDMVLISLREAKENPSKKYTHILIDESQDLSRMQIEFLKALYNEKEYSSITFITDVAQSIYPQAWLVKNRSFSSIGYDMTGKSSSLSKNYRTTTQIAQAAFSLIQKDKELIEDNNFVKPSLIDKQGEYPIFQSFKTKNEEATFIGDLINNELKKKYNLRDIVIIARLSNQLKEIKEYLDEKDIPNEIFNNNKEFDFARECVKLVTMHSIKGLEFKCVIMIGVNSTVMPLKSQVSEIEDDETIESRERKLFYVGMTRATEKLIITSEGIPSKFIKDIDYRYLRMKEGCNARRISRIKVEDYKMLEKIKDKYSEEEQVRQWFLRELIETYKYPIDLIDIEQKVYLGSDCKFVDIVISKYVDNSEVNPYIYIEVKKWGEGIKDALKQLESYMAASLTVKYGVVTDGNEIKIVNRNLEEVKDIPKFDVSMLPSTVETVEFINIKRNVRNKFIKDLSNPKEIYAEENGIERKLENLIAIPIFNEIAAGNPILINETMEGKYYLPREWVGNIEDLFILKIKGDSMIKKDILDGDYVLIKKQNIAENGDTVAVDIEGNATLKTYRSMGSQVILMPENDAYEPIMLEEGQFNIIGTLVGVIKQ